eukprot:scaffold7260_cov63-Phaeocystis_antarctica.AAC.3
MGHMIRISRRSGSPQSEGTRRGRAKRRKQIRPRTLAVAIDRAIVGLVGLLRLGRLGSTSTDLWLLLLLLSGRAGHPRANLWLGSSAATGHGRAALDLGALLALHAAARLIYDATIAASHLRRGTSEEAEAPRHGRAVRPQLLGRREPKRFLRLDGTPCVDQRVQLRLLGCGPRDARHFGACLAAALGSLCHAGSQRNVSHLSARGAFVGLHTAPCL